MKQESLFERPTPHTSRGGFDGPGLVQSDVSKLRGDLRAVYDVMRDGRERSLEQIAAQAGVSLLSVGSRVRDLRKPRFGGFDIPEPRVEGRTRYYHLKDPR